MQGQIETSACPNKGSLIEHRMVLMTAVYSVQLKFTFISNLPNNFAVYEEITFAKAFFTTRKRNLRRLCFHRCQSVHKRGCLGLCPGGSLTRGYLSRGVSVQGVSVQGGHCLGGSLYWGVIVQGVSVMETPPYGNEPAVRIPLECILVNCAVHSRSVSRMEFHTKDYLVHYEAFLELPPLSSTSPIFDHIKGSFMRF